MGRVNGLCHRQQHQQKKIVSQVINYLFLFCISLPQCVEQSNGLSEHDSESKREAQEESKESVKREEQDAAKEEIKHEEQEAAEDEIKHEE